MSIYGALKNIAGGADSVKKLAGKVVGSLEDNRDALEANGAKDMIGLVNPMLALARGVKRAAELTKVGAQHLTREKKPQAKPTLPPNSGFKNTLGAERVRRMVARHQPTL